MADPTPLDLQGARTLLEVFDRRVQTTPERTVYVSIPDGETEQGRFSYAELETRVRAIAACLAEQKARGERIVLLFPPGLACPAAFLGTLLAGAAAVPAPPPDAARLKRTLPRLRSIFADARPTLVLTSTKILSTYEACCEKAPELRDVPALAVEEIPDKLAGGFRPAGLGPDDLAYLQYTSGSTSTPKGVMVSHGNLLHNSECLRRLFGWDAASRSAAWMPYFHDFGLVEGLIQPLYVGATCYLLSPLTLLKAPQRWLETISRYRVTHSSAPCFAFDHCVRRVPAADRDTLDLRSWRAAVIGAEPIRRETLDRFTETFAPCGFRRETFRPAYGLAEATLVVSMRAAEEPLALRRADPAALERDGRFAAAGDEEAGARVLVGCGRPVPGIRVAIADPETAALPPGRVGEIWVHGESVAHGYWGRAEESRETFGAHLKDGDGPFLRTGDLGFLDGGELFVTGRIKDLVIIRGQNHYPQDIEWTVAGSHPSLAEGSGVAFAIDGEGGEALVVVHEVARDAADGAPILAAVREAVADQHDLQVHAVALVRRGSIPKTSSGKVQRRACRAAFLASELEAVFAWRESAAPAGPQPAAAEAPATTRRAEEIRDWLVAWIAARAGIAPTEVGHREPLARYGLDSMASVDLIAALEAFVGRRLSPTLVYERSTVDALAHHLSEAGGAPRPAGRALRTMPAPARAARSAAARGRAPAPPGDGERIAVVGLSCRMPGAGSREVFWDLLRGGVDAVREVPRERWDVDAYYDPDPDAPGKMCTRFGGFLDGVDLFDASFFGIAPREAVGMDPQQRLVLETAWEALEHAGIAADRLAGSRTGVFLGIASSDYVHLQIEHHDPERLEAHRGTGSALSIAANRLSYVLGLQGPSIAVDTACSSSLVAVHLACQSLLVGETDLVVTGGAHLVLSPDITIIFSKARMQAADGRCKTFDAAADGYVRGEGCGLLVLKRLSDALADGSNILAVIRGSAVNQDGQSNGLTAPNREAQEAVIRDALAAAGVAPMEVGYVEAHGTGTSLGDPIEVQALGAALCAGRAADRPLLVGSVKTNIGHLEAAAGVAGLIKVILALGHREIPPHLHFRTPNPYIPWERLAVQVPTRLIPWPAIDGRRIAGVSSFGFGGTNSHVVVEEPPAAVPLQEGCERPLHLLPISARSETALRELASRYEAALAGDPPFADVCFTAGAGRSHFAHRLAVAAASAGEARERLAAFLRGEEAPGLTVGEAELGERVKVAFLFTGQGSPYPGMSLRLFETQPAFRRALERCDELLRPHLDLPLLEVLYGGGPHLDETLYAQPALVALEVALAELWRSWGVEPDLVLGHSVGEYAAACVAGVMDLADALRLVAARGRLLQATAPGAMAALEAGEERVAAALEPWSGQASIAAVNGPANLVISGEEAAVEAVMARLRAEGVRARRLAVSRAFHSALLDPALPELEREAAGVALAAPRIGLASNLTGELLAEAPTAEYWRRHARGAVRFAAGVEALRRAGAGAWLEVGPTATLLGMAAKVVPDGLFAASLRPGRDDWEQMLESLALLYARGVEIDWEGYDREYPRRRVPLPTYPWERARYWIAAGRTQGAARASHPLLGRRLDSPLPQAQFESEARADALSYLADHRVAARLTVPFAAYLEMAVAAAAQEGEERALRDVVLAEPLVLEPGAGGPLQLVFDGEAASFQVFGQAPDARPEGQPAWRLLAAGAYDRAADGVAPARLARRDLAAVRARCGEELSAERFYGHLREGGLEPGPSLRLLARIWRRNGEALAELRIEGGVAGELARYEFHPGVLAACTQLFAAALPREQGCAPAVLPSRLAGFRLPGRASRDLWCHAELRPAQDGAACGDLAVLDGEGRPVAELSGVELHLAGELAPQRAGDLEDWLYEIDWRPWSRLAGGPERAPLEGPAVRHLAERLSARAEELAPAAADLAGELLPRLECLSVDFVLGALAQLGWRARPGERVELDGLLAGLGIAGRFRRLTGRLLEMLEEEGVLEKAGGGWLVLRAADPGDPLTALAELAVRFPGCEGELTLLRRCGERLADVLRGAFDPIDLLFPGGDLGAAEKLYQDSPLVRADNALLREAVSAAAERLPAGRALRVVEIGAGTGAATAHLLPVLPADRTEYLFTDVSRLFTAKAEEKFGRHPFLRYRLLDIERDPVEQGLAPHRFDLVVAANVLHATADLRATLLNVRRLLAPDGLLLLLEGTGRQRWVDLIFGLTDGWWRFADTDLRPSYPLLTRGAWLALLGECGFPEAAVVPQDEGAPQAVVLARSAPPASPAAVAPAREGDGASWLLLADRAGLGARLGELLAADGGRSTLAYQAGAPAPGQGCAVVDPFRPEGLARLLAGVRDGGGCAGVVCLWGLDAPGADSAAEPGPAAERLSAGVLHLVHALAAARLPGGPRLWLVTRGAQPAGGSLTRPAAAVLWGMGQVVSLEHPELWGGLVDLDPVPAAGEAELLLAEIRGSDGEDRVAFRTDQRYAARLVRRPEREEGPLPLRYDGTYLLTGGLGGLGLLVAEWMVGHGVRHLVLLGRRGPSPAARRTLRRLERAGAKVLAVQADVTREEDLAAVLLDLERGGPPLRGVLHAAGTLADGTLLQQDRRRFAEVLAPKVAGAWHLHRLTEGEPLDLFVLFSSAASLIGSSGQANHAAANAFLDALAHWRRQRGLPGLSINWGAWGEIGAAAERGVEGRMRARGVDTIPARRGIEALEKLLRHDAVQVGVIPLRWPALLAAHPQGDERPLLADLLRERNRTAEPARAVGLRDWLHAAPPGERMNLLRTHTRDQVVQILGFGASHVLKPRQGFFELGMDSLTALELRNRLQASVGSALPSTLVFDYPNLDSLTGYLAREVLALEAAPAPPARESAGEGLLKQIEGLSDTEIDYILARQAAAAGEVQ